MKSCNLISLFVCLEEAWDADSPTTHCVSFHLWKSTVCVQTHIVLVDQLISRWTVHFSLFCLHSLCVSCSRLPFDCRQFSSLFAILYFIVVLPVVSCVSVFISTTERFYRAFSHMLLCSQVSDTERLHRHNSFLDWFYYYPLVIII